MKKEVKEKRIKEETKEKAKAIIDISTSEQIPYAKLITRTKG